MKLILPGSVKDKRKAQQAVKKAYAAYAKNLAKIDALKAKEKVLIKKLEAAHELHIDLLGYDFATTVTVKHILKNQGVKAANKYVAEKMKENGHAV
jgi:uncharacterized protein (DUF2164 family)